MMKYISMMVITMTLLCAFSAAHAADRDTPERDGQFLALPAGEDIDAGLLVGVVSGKVYKATSGLPLTIAGRAEKTVSSGVTLVIRRGVFRWGQYTTNTTLQVTSSDIGSTVYVYDSDSVAKSPPTASYTNTAGKVYDVDDYGVWVRSGYW